MAVHAQIKGLAALFEQIRGLADAPRRAVEKLPAQRQLGLPAAAELEWRYEAGEQHITRVMNNHLSLEAAMEGVASLALAPGAEVWLTHMSASHGHAVDFQAEMQAALGGRANVLVAPE